MLLCGWWLYIQSQYLELYFLWTLIDFSPIHALANITGGTKTKPLNSIYSQLSSHQTFTQEAL